MVEKAMFNRHQSENRIFLRLPAVVAFFCTHRQESEYAIDPDVADSAGTVDIVGIPVDSEFGLKASAASAIVGVDCAVFFAAVCARQGPHPTMQA